jgi:hypothetical protein
LALRLSEGLGRTDVSGLEEHMLPQWDCFDPAVVPAVVVADELADSRQL